MEFVKRGERVEAEAAAVAAASHPGVVELVDTADGVLRTIYLSDARPLAAALPLAADEVAGVVAAVAATLADLHERGVVHGGLDATHVLVAADGRPVLCSLGRDGSPADDILALGTLGIAALAGGPGVQIGPPSEGSRWRRAPRIGPAGAGGASMLRLRRRRRSLGPMLAPDAAVALGAVLSEATAADPDARLTAGALATAVHQRVPTARLPRPAGRPHLPLARSGPAARSNRTGWVAATVAGAAVLAAVLALVPGALRGRRPAADPLSSAGGPAPARPTSAGDRTSSSVVGPDGTAPAPVAVRVWPPEPLEFRDGILTVSGARYALGRTGDVVVAGDWDCSGHRAPALFRPGTGEVFAFAGWPAEGEATTARPLGTVAGATDVRVVDADGDGCDDLELTRPGADPVHLAPAA